MYLYQRQQVSKYRADNAGCDESRNAHQVMADAYGTLITQTKKSAPEARP